MVNKSKIKAPKWRMVLWGVVGAIAGWFAFNAIGLIIGVIGGVYIGNKIMK